MSRKFEVRSAYGSNHRTERFDVRTGIEPAPVAESIKALAQRVLTRGSTSNSGSNHDRTGQFEGHRTEGGSVRTEVRTSGASSMAQGCSHRTDRTSNCTDPETPCPTCGCGSLWRDQAGDWHCERCTPPGAKPVRTWRNFSGAKTPPAPSRPTEAWPADLNTLLRRVACAFEWSDTDRRDFIAWARRSPEGLAEARRFLEAECQKLPIPGLSERRRTALDMLAADPALNAAWTCADDGDDPVVLTLAVRGAGTCELAIPREHFDALGLPGLINRLADPLHAKIGGAA